MGNMKAVILEFTRQERPVLDAWDTGRGQWAVWCKYCQVYHFHGAMDGHRVAHCHDMDRRGRQLPLNPYRTTGYILRYAGPVTPEMRRDMERARPKGPVAAVLDMALVDDEGAA
jgi:hypothetical protein